LPDKTHFFARPNRDARQAKGLDQLIRQVLPGFRHGLKTGHRALQLHFFGLYLQALQPQATTLRLFLQCLVQRNPSLLVLDDLLELAQLRSLQARSDLLLAGFFRLLRTLGQGRLQMTFAYVCLHLLSYAWFDMGFEWGDIAQDIAKRPFILVGFSAFLILLALAATSFNRAIRRLGARRWQALHRGVYAVAVLAILHFWWMRAGKQNFAEVLVYAAILIGLLGWRLARRLRSRSSA